MFTLMIVLCEIQSYKPYSWEFNLISLTLSCFFLLGNEKLLEQR